MCRPYGVWAPGGVSAAAYARLRGYAYQPQDLLDDCGRRPGVVHLDGARLSHRKAGQLGQRRCDVVVPPLAQGRKSSSLEGYTLAYLLANDLDFRA
jgi:hypothetical protein